MYKGRPIEWHTIDWQQCYEKVCRIQNDIVVAYNRGNMKEVGILQNLLVDSFGGRAIAVRTLTTNKGKDTAGVDGQKTLNPTDKMELLKSLRAHKSTPPKPVRRVWLSKDGKPIKKDHSNGRALGIPCIYDRAAQSLWTLALAPIAECSGDRHSYGFRPHRSTQDAMQALYLMLATRNRPNWILEADIKGFFDNITHAWILEQIPMDKTILSKWLKAGYIDRNRRYDTDSGVPQGGPISPIIANMVLDGLSEHVAKAVAPHSKKGKSMKVLLVRYADDFVVTGENLEIINSVITPAINTFLGERGLSLNSQKTKVTNLQDGFSFLGFNFRTYPRRAHPTGVGLLIKPDRKQIQRLREKISDLFKERKQSSAYSIILELNPVLRGWANYYRSVISKRIFSAIDWLVWHKSFQWAKRKHRSTGVHDILSRYYRPDGGMRKVFYGNKNGSEIQIYRLAYLPIRRHMIIKDCNPFLLENCDYFNGRRHRENQSTWDKIRWNVLKKTKSVCLVCGQQILAGENMDMHHIIPRKKSGPNTKENLMPLHRECHIQVTQTKDPRLKARFVNLGISPK